MSEHVVECIPAQVPPWTCIAVPHLRTALERHGAQRRPRSCDFATASLANGDILLRTRPQPHQDYRAMTPETQP